VIVRPETDRDLDGIREVNIVAFQGHPYSQQTEHLIVEASRARTRNVQRRAGRERALPLDVR
jgi:hypothetical protein